MELLAVEVHSGQLAVGDAELGRVFTVVETCVHLKPGAGLGRADQVDDRFQRDERLPAPVHRDVGEQAMLDPVPFAGPGRQVADSDLKPDLVGQLLQLDLPPVSYTHLTLPTK